jgi:hypothetical protein
MLLLTITLQLHISLVPLNMQFFSASLTRDYCHVDSRRRWNHVGYMAAQSALKRFVLVNKVY